MLTSGFGGDVLIGAVEDYAEGGGPVRTPDVLVLSVVFHLNVEHLLGLLPVVSLSLDGFDVDTNNPYHAKSR